MTLGNPSEFSAYPNSGTILPHSETSITVHPSVPLSKKTDVTATFVYQTTSAQGTSTSLMASPQHQALFKYWLKKKISEWNKWFVIKNWTTFEQNWFRRWCFLYSSDWELVQSKMLCSKWKTKMLKRPGGLSSLSMFCPCVSSPTPISSSMGRPTPSGQRWLHLSVCSCLSSVGRIDVMKQIFMTFLGPILFCDFTLVHK